MNFVHLSPHFPPNYYLFAVQLQRLGATVLGLADEPYDYLRGELRGALAEYYRVSDMRDYDALLRALGYFTHRFGRIDRVESHNEYWLETEARLRTDFNVPGPHVSDLPGIKRKSEMKKLFDAAGVAGPRGEVIRTPDHAYALAGEYGYPLVAKPDIGVGAGQTYRIGDERQLAGFLATKPGVDYILQEFIKGTIQSFDGLADRHGNVVFYTSHIFSQGIMETVNEDRDLYYYSLREIPADLSGAGHRLVTAFGIRERFFHIEFFRTADGRLVALEVNVRPPGGLTTDMFNFANDIDIYHEYANVVVNDRFAENYARPYFCGYAGRKWNRRYAHAPEEVAARFGWCIVQQEPISGVFAGALGNYGYVLRSPNLEDVMAAIRYIQEQ